MYMYTNMSVFFPCECKLYAWPIDGNEHPFWVLETKPGSSARTVSTLDY